MSSLKTTISSSWQRVQANLKTLVSDDLCHQQTTICFGQVTMVDQKPPMQPLPFPTAIPPLLTDNHKSAANKLMHISTATMHIAQQRTQPQSHLIYLHLPIAMTAGQVYQGHIG